MKTEPSFLMLTRYFYCIPNIYKFTYGSYINYDVQEYRQERQVEDVAQAAIEDVEFLERVV